MNKNNNPFLLKRILAGFADYAIIFIYILIVMYFYGVQDEDGSTTIEGVPAFSVFIFWIIMTIGIEQLFGVTIGNYLSDIKPVSIDDKTFNNKISLSQSIKRHFLDIIDMSFFGLIGILLIKNTVNHQRLGDLWAKTIVVSSK